MYFKFYLLTLILTFSLSSCEQDVKSSKNNLIQLERLEASDSNVHFANNVEESIENTMINNNNIYAGGGIAVGDINNDGLEDFIAISNQEAPALYLNKGDFEFEDISDDSGLLKTEGWSTGVMMEDINQDGYLDIYISKGIFTDKDPLKRVNLLYINNKDNTFIESAEQYGIASTNVTIQSVFFDFDLDGDLDLYLLNQPVDTKEIKIKELAKRRMSTKAKKNSDTFYINENGVFRDASYEMGITNWGNGLGIGIADFNEDGYPDIYITNDFSMDNFLYINNKGNGFIENAKRSFKHESYFAMGVDIADINNDGMLDIFEVEMLPKERKRSIMNMGSMNPQLFEELGNLGFVPQYMRNSLQLNRAKGIFSEIAQYANVGKTDWSWGTLLIDIDDDGYRDILVTNGIVNDIKDRDFATKGNKLSANTGGKLTLEQHMDLVVSTKVQNYCFQNRKEGKFEDVSERWGFADKGFSNGLASGDFDNDGDLDLLVNNINEKIWIYKNNSQENGNSNINFKLKGSNKNRNGIGAKVKIFYNGQMQYAEQYVVRGFISSSQHLIHFGLGEQNKIDSLEIIWPDKRYELIRKNLVANETYTLDYANASIDNRPAKVYRSIFKGASQAMNLTNSHKEIIYDDYAKELLLPHKLSQLGPALATGDLNNDGQDDIFIGSGRDFASKIYLSNGTNYTLKADKIWELESPYEDIGAAIFDADGDGDNDLYVTSGSNEYPINSKYYQDRLYINDGNGNFTKSKNALPNNASSTGVVIAADIDGDMDLDLFVGGRLVPGLYPTTPQSSILINDGGKFTNQTDNINSSISTIGMVTSAEWTDYDNDGDKDLILVGEWMGIKLFENTNGKLTDISALVGLENTEGWWFTVKEVDFDKDGDMDYVCGNIGLNHKFKASEEKPFQIYSDDFDDNEKLDIVLAYHEEDKFYPVRGRDCSSEQMPFIKEKFPTFASFGEAEMDDIFGDKLDKAFVLKAKTFASIILENNGGKFNTIPLPMLGQLSAITGVVEYDFNQDGFNDLLLAGNMYNTEAETSSADANYGMYMLGDGNGNYKEVYLGDSGFYTPGDVKHMKMIDFKGNKLILIANNNAKFQSYITHEKNM